MNAPLQHEDLNYTFERQQYAWVRLEGESREHVIFVHDIFQRKHDSEIVYQLLVTTYLQFTTTAPFAPSALPETAASHANEMVLRFKDFKKMRTPEDGEMISIEDILSARPLEHLGRIGVRHVFQHRPGLSNLFSRRCAIY